MSTQQQSAAAGALKGALAALVGGLALRAVWGAGQGLLPANEKLPSPTGETVKKLAEQRGVTLSDAQQRAATLGMYSAVMLGWGAVFGAAQARFSPPLLASSLALGGWIYALNFPKATGVLPRTGVLKPPSEQTTAQAALPVAAHVAFGLATAAAYRAID